MNGPVFVSLSFAVQYTSTTSVGAGSAHGKHYDADGPAVDEVIITLGSDILQDDFRSEVVRRPTHGLLVVRVSSHANG